MAENYLMIEEAKIQACSLLGNISASLSNDTVYQADPDILDKVFNDDKIKKEFKAAESILINYEAFIQILRLGMRIGAYYEIEDHKKNNYEYY